MSGQNTYHDNNHVSVLAAVSSVDGTSIVLLWADPVTHRLLETGAGGGGSFTVLVPTGTVNGVNNTFVFATAPQVIVLDNGNTMNQISSDGTVNWTGTTTVVLNQVPNFNIFGF